MAREEQPPQHAVVADRAEVAARAEERSRVGLGVERLDEDEERVVAEEAKTPAASSGHARSAVAVSAGGALGATTMAVGGVGGAFAAAGVIGAFAAAGGGGGSAARCWRRRVRLAFFFCALVRPPPPSPPASPPRGSARPPPPTRRRRRASECGGPRGRRGRQRVGGVIGLPAGRTGSGGGVCGPRRRRRGGDRRLAADRRAAGRRPAGGRRVGERRWLGRRRRLHAGGRRVGERRRLGRLCGRLGALPRLRAPDEAFCGRGGRRRPRRPVHAAAVVPAASHERPSSPRTPPPSNRPCSGRRVGEEAWSWRRIGAPSRPKTARVGRRLALRRRLEEIRAQAPSNPPPLGRRATRWGAAAARRARRWAAVGWCREKEGEVERRVAEPEVAVPLEQIVLERRGRNVDQVRRLGDLFGVEEETTRRAFGRGRERCEGHGEGRAIN